MLLFSEVAEIFSKIESKSGRLEMADILGELFKKANPDEIGRLVYITQGILSPPYEGIDLGMGEKFAISAIADACGYSKLVVDKNYQKSGDLGETAEYFIRKKKQTS